MSPRAQGGARAHGLSGEFEFEFDCMNIKVHPKSMADSPPGADLTLLLLRRRPRTGTSLQSTSQTGAPVNNPSTPWIASPATENARQRRTAKPAAPAASLPPLPPSKPCAKVADPPAAALRGAVVLPPRLDATSTKRRVNVVAAAPSSMAVDLRPSSVQLVQHSPLHQNLPATYESTKSMPARACPMPNSGRSGRRTGSPRYHTRAKLLHGHAAPRGFKAFIPTAPSPSAST